MVAHKFPSVADLSSLVKNYTLISLIENAKSFTTPVSKPVLERSNTTIVVSNKEQLFDLGDLEECKSEEENDNSPDLNAELPN